LERAYFLPQKQTLIIWWCLNLGLSTKEILVTLSVALKLEFRRFRLIHFSLHFSRLALYTVNIFYSSFALFFEFTISFRLSSTANIICANSLPEAGKFFIKPQYSLPKQPVKILGLSEHKIWIVLQIL